jgi:hypothetical protein
VIRALGGVACEMIHEATPLAAAPRRCLPPLAGGILTAVRWRGGCAASAASAAAPLSGPRAAARIPPA